MKKYTAVFSIVFVALVLFIFWYDNEYSMDMADSYVVNNSSLESRVLIATQGSEYKDELVNKIVKSDQLSTSYIKVIDISDLGEINPNSWTAIVIIHTWEMWKPPLIVKNFVSRNLKSKNLVVFTTSGGSDSSMPNIDGITGASIIKEVPEKSEVILHRLALLLQ